MKFSECSQKGGRMNAAKRIEKKQLAEIDMHGREQKPIEPLLERMPRIKINDTYYYENRFFVIAGPCSVENREQMEKVGETFKEIKGIVEGFSGILVLRGGAYKPRTSPRSFQGLGEEGLKLLKEIKDAVGMPIVSEIVDPRHVELFAKYDLDILQIGARNAQNYELIREAARSMKPILLKRGMAEGLTEWLGAAQYILEEGNEQVILCERGIKAGANDGFTRNVLDLPTALLAKEANLPVIIDPSHATGRVDLIKQLSHLIALSNLDGIMIEAHPSPREALSDRNQQLTLEELADLIEDIAQLREIYYKLNTLNNKDLKPIGAIEYNAQQL